MTEQREEHRISRRTIAKGAAWAIPAVPLVVATPAYASSGGGPIGRFLSACKLSGGSCERETGIKFGYLFVLQISNPTVQDLYVYPKTGLGNVTPDGEPLEPFFKVTSSVPFTYDSATKGATLPGGSLSSAEKIPAGGNLTILIRGKSTNSANVDATGDLYMPWGHTVTIGGDGDHPYDPAPTLVPTPNPVGEGWFKVPIIVAAFPPCTDCQPAPVIA
jgi:hypothetical protein